MITIVPTRGRPHNAYELASAWEDAKSSSHLVFAVDNDQRELYQPIVEATFDNAFVGWVYAPRMKMGPTLNHWARLFAVDTKIIGFMGDDHRPRTLEWDKKIQQGFDELGGTGIVYGDDGNWGEGLPTSVFMSSDIIKKIDYMHPPELIHLYLDNFWLEFGKAIGRIKYMSDVFIEHMHPHLGKAEDDAGYQEVNAPEIYAHDLNVLEEYERTQMDFDVQKVKELL